MFKVMDHFDDLRDERWESLDGESDMGNSMPKKYREMFRYLLESGKTECCEPGKTFILDFAHDDLVGHMRYVWAKHRLCLSKIMRLLAHEARKKNDNYLGRDGEPDDAAVFTLSTTWFFLPFEMFSPEFKELRSKTILPMDEYGTFAVDCWLKALENRQSHKALRAEISEYFYSSS